MTTTTTVTGGTTGLHLDMVIGEAILRQEESTDKRVLRVTVTEIGSWMATVRRRENLIYYQWNLLFLDLAMLKMITQAVHQLAREQTLREDEEGIVFKHLKHHRQLRAGNLLAVVSP